MQREDKTLYYEVKVGSEVKPLVKAVGILEYADADLKKITVLGGALAEHLCEKYGDTLDPDIVARAAHEAFRELRAEAHPTATPGDIEPITGG